MPTVRTNALVHAIRIAGDPPMATITLMAHVTLLPLDQFKLLLGQWVLVTLAPISQQLTMIPFKEETHENAQ